MDDLLAGDRPLDLVLIVAPDWLLVLASRAYSYLSVIVYASGWKILLGHPSMLCLEADASEHPN